MNVHQKLLTTPLPVDRVARRVTRKAKPEHVWAPMPKQVEHIVFSKTALPVATPPGDTAIVSEVTGARRDRMVVIGYAATQNRNKNRSAKWVVRCDCGNYEHRSSILRWLGTKAPDMCTECRTRVYLLKGEWADREPAERQTVAR